MNNKNIIIAGAIAVGLYLFSQTKTTAQKAAQKVDISRLPVAQIRYMIAHAAALGKTGKEVAALKAEEARRVAAWKAAQKVAPKRIGQPTTQAARIAAARRAAAQRAAAQRAAARRAAAQRAAAQRAAARRAAARKAAAQKIGKKIGKTVAQKVAQKRVAPWKAPYKFPKLKFRVITPSDKLRNLVKKNITRKKAVQQKKVQKTTPGTPSDRRKSRLEALYGSHWRSHWHDIWVQRQK